MNYSKVPSNVKIGRMVARELGVKKCGREDALEVFEWARGLSCEVMGIRSIPLNTPSIKVETINLTCDITVHQTNS